jgi:hypothetical protein
VFMEAYEREHITSKMMPCCWYIFCMQYQLKYSLPYWRSTIQPLDNLQKCPAHI